MHSGRHLKVLEGKREKEEWEEKEAGENQGETNGGNQGGREFRASKGGRDLGRKERRRQRWGEKDKEIGDKEAARVQNEEGKRAGRGSL